MTLAGPIVWQARTPPARQKGGLELGTKLTSFESPLTGKTGNLTNVGGLFNLIKGALVIIAVYFAATTIFNRIRAAVPAPIAGLIGRVAPAADPAGAYGKYGI